MILRENEQYFRGFFLSITWKVELTDLSTWDWEHIELNARWIETSGKTKNKIFYTI